jgi:hypothetical protein
MICPVGLPVRRRLLRGTESVKRKFPIYIGLSLALLLILGVAQWFLRSPTVIEQVREPGAEALTQIYGTGDGSDGEPDVAAEQPVPAENSEARIGGQVVLPTGEPAVGAVVTLQAAAEEEPIAVQADGGGMFAFSDVTDGLHVVEASLTGYGPAVALGVRAGQTRLRLALESGRSVEGLVLHDGTPVPNAVVHLGGAGMFPQRAVVADASGRYAVSGLQPGTYHLLATAEGYGSGFGTEAIVDAAEGEAVRLDIDVQATPRTTIEIVDEQTGDPVATAVVSVSQRPLHVLALTTTAFGGLMQVSYLPRGDVFARVRSPGYLPWEGPLRISSSDATIRIPLARGATIRGRVTDEVGNPVPIVRLSAIVTTEEGAKWELREALFDDFHRLVRPDGTPFWMPSPVFRSDRDGTFTLSGLPAGAARVIASREGWGSAVSGVLELDINRDYEPLILKLVSPRRVRGRVEDAAGGAISGALVSVRPRGVPEWAATESIATSSTGVFEFGDLPGRVSLSVRHPDFASTEIELELPEAGLDDVIVRLSGAQHPAVSGRIFTRRGAPAVGALVWLMAGNSELPVCQATVSANGWFEATHCTSMPERLIASYSGHAPLVAELGNLEPRDWTMPLGGEIELLSRGHAVVVTVEPVRTLPPAHWPRPQVSLDSWSRDIVRNVAEGPYRVRCSAERYDDAFVDVTVAEGRRTEAACPTSSRMVEFTLAVVDPQGAPIPGAMVFVDRVDPPIRTMTSSRGTVTVRSRPGVWLDAEAMHERWGRGTLRFYAHYEPRTDPPRIVIDQPIAGEDPGPVLESLASWGVDAEESGRSLLVSAARPGTPAAGAGLRRLDYILWARPMGDFRFGIGVKRDGELLTFELVREPDVE